MPMHCFNDSMKKERIQINDQQPNQSHQLPFTTEFIDARYDIDIVASANNATRNADLTARTVMQHIRATAARIRIQCRCVSNRTATRICDRCCRRSCRRCC